MQNMLNSPAIQATIHLIMISVFGLIYYRSIRRYILYSGEYNENKIETCKLGKFHLKIRFINMVFIIIWAIPLVIYPIVILANIMQFWGVILIGFQPVVIVPILFGISTTTYPLTIVLSFGQNLKKRNTHLMLSVIPLIHIVLILLTFSFWNVMEPFLM